MHDHWTTKLASLATAATVVLTGCSTIRQWQADDTEQLLAAAGFSVQLADTAEQQTQLKWLPPYRLMSHMRDGAVEYTYGDPETCKCVYVGGSKEYSEYQRLSAERRMARDRLRHAEDAWDWDYWGGWTPWW